jgi:hypothetical protein
MAFPKDLFLSHRKFKEYDRDEFYFVRVKYDLLQSTGGCSTNFTMQKHRPHQLTNFA